MPWTYNFSNSLSTPLLGVRRQNGLPGGHSEWEPPDPFPNSEVKPLSADDSVGPPHAKVGHCQALYAKPPHFLRGLFFQIL